MINIADLKRGVALTRTSRRAILSFLSIAIVAGFALPELLASESALKDTKPGRLRETVDVEAYPWASIGKVNFAGFDEQQSCTGSVIGLQQYLTAAHCLYNARTPAHQLLSAGSIHFLLGFSRGEYRMHRVAVRYVVSPKFNYRDKKAAGNDWAVLYVDEAFPPEIRPLRLATTRSLPGTSVETAGYSAFQSKVMTADRHCQVTAVSDDGNLVFNDCVFRRGSSGAPLLGKDTETEVSILGVISRAAAFDEPEERSTAAGVAAAAAPIAEFIASQPAQIVH
jgi:protease YdgD